jgi:hypothetical protein
MKTCRHCGKEIEIGTGGVLWRLRGIVAMQRREPCLGTDFLYYLAQSVAFDKAIAAFQPKARK